MPKRALLWTALAAAWAGLCALMLRRFAEFPGLHGDEAWVGLYALRIGREGITSLHEMNSYTGPLYGWLLSKSLSWSGAGTASLRLPGLALNAAAAAGMAAHLSRRFGFAAGFCWLGLLACSGMFVLKSRVAWEVYALQGALLAAILAVLCAVLESDRPSLALGTPFLYATYAGVFNHFIFLSVPLSLAVYFCARAAAGRPERGRSLGLSAAALGLCSALCLLKPLVSDGFWMAHRAWLGPAALAAPALAALAWRGGAAAELRLEALLRGPLFAGRARLWRSLGAAGLAAFFLMHWVPLLQIWSGVAVLQRLASWDPPLAVKVALYAWAAVPLGVFFTRAFESLKPSRADALAPYERLLVLWPLAYVAVFPLFRDITSIRYYVIVIFLLTASLSRSLPRAAARLRPGWAALLAAPAALLVAMFWREPARAEERPPILFRVGTHKERSFYFLRKEGLCRALEAERTCRLRNMDSFIDIPLVFLFNSKGFECDVSKVAVTRWCEECRRPPYLSLRIEHAGR